MVGNCSYLVLSVHNGFLSYNPFWSYNPFLPYNPFFLTHHISSLPLQPMSTPVAPALDDAGKTEAVKHFLLQASLRGFSNLCVLRIEDDGDQYVQGSRYVDMKPVVMKVEEDVGAVSGGPPECFEDSPYSLVQVLVVFNTAERRGQADYIMMWRDNVEEQVAKLRESLSRLVDAVRI